MKQSRMQETEEKKRITYEKLRLKIGHIFVQTQNRANLLIWSSEKLRLT